jgi:hypothetical protein
VIVMYEFSNYVEKWKLKTRPFLDWRLKRYELNLQWNYI